MSIKIGIDVGGTFTDFLAYGPGRKVTVHKELSTPADPSEAVLNGLAALARMHATEPARFLAAVDTIVHGTTVTTNAVLTGTTPPTGLVTTRGFRDALQMRRGVREVMYDNRWHPPPPVVPRDLRLPVTERIDVTGTVVTPLDAADLDRAIDTLIARKIEGVAICFMHAYANATHEEAAAKRVAARMPRAYLSVSSRVLPQVRFYERTSTTALNAAVGPIFARYVERLTARLEQARYRGVLLIMQSNGGVGTPQAVARLAASTLLSGPAAAPAAGLASCGRNFISVDMGGTSFDAAVVINGEPAVTTASTVNRYAMALPSMEINTIGAGGGSIAWIDAGGLLHMGPQSAGALPGPACYGRGGSLPTCTDANLVLGYLSAEFFAGGRMPLDRKGAERAISEHVAKPLGLDLAAAAAGMIHVINVNMAAAIREISIQKGIDPRGFPLVLAGGAGPLHGAAIAAELGITRLIVPRDSSIFCASGMLRTDFKHDFVRSFARALPDSRAEHQAVKRLVAAMTREARTVLDSERIARARQRLRLAVDVRYLGQYHEVTVPVTDAELACADWNAVRERFHRRHDRLYGYELSDAGTPIELLNVRLEAIGVTDKPPLARARKSSVASAHAQKGVRPIYLDGRFRKTPVYDGERLMHGNRLTGPAIVESTNTTILVPAKCRLEIDALGNAVLERS